MEHTKQEHKQVVYTASIGIEALRMALAYSTRREHVLRTVDIKAAFLNAQLLPRNRQAAEEAVEPQTGVALGESTDGSKVAVEVGSKEVVVLTASNVGNERGVCGK